MTKSKRVPKNMYFCFIDYTKAFDCADHNKLWKILQEMGIPDQLICLLRNLCAGQEVNRTGHGTIDWFQIGKGVHQGYILSPWLLNLYAEYIMRNGWLTEAQAGIKIAGRNINNLRYVGKKAMATHCNALAWKIPWTEEPGRLQSMGSRRVGHNWSDLAIAMHFI